MIGSFPAAGDAVAVAEGAVVCPKAAPTLSKMQNVIVTNLTLDSFIRDYDAAVRLFVTNKDSISQNDTTFYFVRLAMTLVSPLEIIS